MLPFPKAIPINGRNFYVKRDVREYIAAAAGDPPPPPREDDEHLMTTKAVREMFGGVSDMWIWRRRQRKSAASGEAA